MASWRCDPYLWVHLAGLATVPLWIDLCLLGLAVGNPTLPGLEIGVIVALGVLPVLVMQWRRPFYIFSLPGLALKPTALQVDQRRLLSQFRHWRLRLGALLVPVPLVWTLLKLYPLAFLARDLTPFSDWGRPGGVAIAALSFLMANLFVQIPVAVLQVLATPDRAMARVAPYAVERVAADFTWVGLTVGKILPSFETPQNSDLGVPSVVETLAPQPVLPVETPRTDSEVAVETTRVESVDGGAKATVEPEFLEHTVEAGAADAPSAAIASNEFALSDVLADATDGPDSAVSTTEDCMLKNDATDDYRPLRHPEVEEADDAITDLDDTNYPQALPAIAERYPNVR